MSTVSHTVEYRTLIQREEESVYMQLEKDSKIYYYVKKLQGAQQCVWSALFYVNTLGLGMCTGTEKIILEGYWKKCINNGLPRGEELEGQGDGFSFYIFLFEFSNNICILVFNFQVYMTESRIIGYLNSYTFCVLKYVHNIHICYIYVLV